MVAVASIVLAVFVGGCTVHASPSDSATASCPAAVTLGSLRALSDPHPLGPGTTLTRAACSGPWVLGLTTGTAAVTPGLVFYRRGSAGYRLVLVDDSGCYDDDARQIGMPITILDELERSLRVSAPTAPGCAQAAGQT